MGAGNGLKHRMAEMRTEASRGKERGKFRFRRGDFSFVARVTNKHIQRPMPSKCGAEVLRWCLVGDGVQRQADASNTHHRT